MGKRGGSLHCIGLAGVLRYLKFEEKKKNKKKNKQKNI